LTECIDVSPWKENKNFYSNPLKGGKKKKKPAKSEAAKGGKKAVTRELKGLPVTEPSSKTLQYAGHKERTS